MIDFNYTAPELLPLRIREVLDAPNEPHRIGGVVYVPEGGEAVMNNLQYIVKDDTRFAMHMAVELCERGDFDSVAEAARWLMSEREGCELAYGETDDGVDSWFTQCGGRFAATFEDGRLVHPGFCELCGGKAVER